MFEHAKKFFWKLIQPFFPSLRDAWIWLGFIEHNYRQPFLYGTIRPGSTLHDLRQHLLSHGFQDDYLAWIDPGEVLNMRKVVNTIFQYHVRLFEDGEIRGHHEYTAESHPLKHLFERGMVHGRDYLKQVLAPWLAEVREFASAATPNPK